MKKVFFSMAAFLMLNSAFAATCTKTGNGISVTSTAPTQAEACSSAQKVLNALM